MKVLVLNAGSSSHKLCLYAVEKSLPQTPPTPLWEAQIDWYPARGEAVFNVKTDKGQPQTDTVSVVSRLKTLSQVLSTLWQGDNRVLDTSSEIEVVGHRVVHGGQSYQASTLITETIKAEIARLSELAPAHNPVNLEGIELMEQLLGKVPQVAVFDTAFHRKMPDTAAIYPGPYDWIQQGIRRYGFHGISHQYCAQRSARILNRELTELRLIICHLGNGGSLTAVRNGQSIDTTMGFTPLEGLMMGTRSGTLDPGILVYLMRQGYSIDQLDRLLNHASGLKGISGVSHDLREITQAVGQGSERAKLAQGLYLHRLKSCIGSMLMSLEGELDVIVFTAGIGEHSAWIRAEVSKSMAFLGLKLDLDKNENSPKDTDIATVDSTIRVLVIHTQEDWAIARDCWHLLMDNTGSP